jgi:hypothetical protein
MLALGAIAWTQGNLASNGPAASGEERAHSGPQFSKVVQENFAHWDLNHDGRLEAKEVDELMNRKGIRGDAAAALATIKRQERMEPDEQRREYAPSEGELVSAHANDAPLQSLDAAQGKPKVYHFESQFRHNLAVLASINHKLYAGDGPNFAAMHQGPIGDCFFFSVTGYMVARDPERLKRMIEAEHGGNFVVHLGDGEHFPVHAPSDAEILINNSAISLEDGIWLTVLEKAIGEKMRSTAKREKRTGEATDAMAHGGSTAGVMRWYSGHEMVNIKLRDPAEAKAHLAQIRQHLPPALKDRKLVAMSMGKDPPPNHKKIPHFGYGHAYAILDYDHGSDEVTVWNPWGNDYTPKGPAGIENGFVTKHGVFRVPLTTLYEQFSSFHLETSKPLPPGSASHQKKPAR